jgi:hypothetical protein
LEVRPRGAARWGAVRPRLWGGPGHWRRQGRYLRGSVAASSRWGVVPFGGATHRAAPRPRLALVARPANNAPPLPLQAKLASMRRTIASRRDALEDLRLDRLSGVARAARGLARAIRQERKASARRAAAFDSDLSRKIDAAMLDNLAAGPGSVLSAIDAWQAASRGGGGGGGALPADGPDAWAPAWRALLLEARAALAAAKAAGGGLDAPRRGGGGGGGAGTWDDDELAAEVEALERAAAKRAAARAAREARRSEALARAVQLEAARQGSGGLLTGLEGGQVTGEDLIGDEEDEEDLGLSEDLGLLELEGQGGGGGGAGARRREQVAALARLEQALSRVDGAGEAAALREAMDKEAAERAAAAEREAAVRWARLRGDDDGLGVGRSLGAKRCLPHALFWPLTHGVIPPPRRAPHREARAQQEALRMASAFEAQLEELEAAAAAAEAVAGAGAAALGAAAAARAAQDAAATERAGGELLWDALGPLESGGSEEEGDGGLSPELLDLIGTLEGTDPSEATGSGRGPAASSSNGSGGGGGGGGGTVVGGAPQLSAAEAALQRELELLRRLEASLEASSGSGGGSGVSGAGEGSAKRRRKRR